MIVPCEKDRLQYFNNLISERCLQLESNFHVPYFDNTLFNGLIVAELLLSIYHTKYFINEKADYKK